MSAADVTCSKCLGSGELPDHDDPDRGLIYRTCPYCAPRPDRLAEIEAAIALARHRHHLTLEANLRDLLAVAKAARDYVERCEAPGPLVLRATYANLRAAIAKLEER